MAKKKKIAAKPAKMKSAAKAKPAPKAKGKPAKAKPKSRAKPAAVRTAVTFTSRHVMDHVTSSPPVPGTNPTPTGAAFVARGTYDSGANSAIVAVSIVVGSGGTAMIVRPTMPITAAGGNWSASFPATAFPGGTYPAAGVPMTLIVQGSSLDGPFELLVPFTFGSTPPPPTGMWSMESGAIDGLTSGKFAVAASNTGVASSNAVYMPFTVPLYGAVAFQNLTTTGNSPSVSFTYAAADSSQGAGPMIGTRWNDAAQTGWFAYLNGPNLQLYEMSNNNGGWAYINNTSIPVTLTDGKAYTITLLDDGTTVTASMVDDTGAQMTSITDSLGASDTGVAFGWMCMDTPSFPFNTVITGVTT